MTSYHIGSETPTALGWAVATLVALALLLGPVVALVVLL